jgi:hypothetical protein
MKVARIVLVLVGLGGLYLLVASLSSLTGGGVVTLPGAGQKVGGSFLLVVSLVITAGAFVLFFRMRGGKK